MAKGSVNYNARETALRVLYNVKEKGAYSNLALDKELAKSNLDQQDRGLTTELVYGTLRWELKLDWIIASYLKTPFHKLPAWIKLILRLGTYQIIQTDIPASAAVNESVKLAKKYGHAGTVKLVNGVLRAISRNIENINYPDLKEDPVKFISIFYSHPYWLVERWIKRYGIEETKALCEANNCSPGLSLRINTLRTSREKIMNELKTQGLEVEKTAFVADGIKILKGFSPRTSELFAKGLVIPQDEAAMMVAHLLAPKPGQLVLDCCAAPGGKTTHIAQLMNNKGMIYAFDLHPHRVKLIEDAALNLGINIIHAEQKDARKLGGLFPARFDSVLVDAPCSGLGVLRRKPDARWRKSIEQLAEFPPLQLEILTSAAQTLKTGGSLLYSTCSTEPEENEKVIEKFLAQNPNFDLVDPRKFLPGAEEAGMVTPASFIRTYPHRHGTDGFFMAKLIRKD
ncbi:MAG TPA: 16S rRNA (cytosine(967)-C(5))-methyltransferase RsmB [Clostridia bacterium]|jgi:16S rRNA (cytosine967-C5)-methyltransferase|nr:16S rRNA (cytosine(967)-C(5))-methyltransferase RsmB [Clostridia bacterium]